MGFKLGLLAGGAAGYVLGTRAGRERYAQIAEATRALMGSRTARSIEEGAREAWATAQEEWPAAAVLRDLTDQSRR